jgi:hypothetical protein
MEMILKTEYGTVVYKATKKGIVASIPVGMNGYEFMLVKDKYERKINAFKKKYGKTKRNSHRSRKYRRRS